ncbi:YusW-like protein [Amphibacillus marinus]|uniref:YusW-like protein n=1 Tax=Amphibacillus marinus TaxID=872970 RepID=A0A1H8K872_9BACI|nr:YusW family protein [Amphibacillus marinus]SEN89163.1 YusW-like protein [Amphibacillus marinus]
MRSIIIALALVSLVACGDQSEEPFDNAGLGIEDQGEPSENELGQPGNTDESVEAATEPLAVNELRIDVIQDSGQALGVDYSQQQVTIERNDDVVITGEAAASEIELFLAHLNMSLQHSISNIQYYSLDFLELDTNEFEGFEAQFLFSNDETLTVAHVFAEEIAEEYAPVLQFNLVIEFEDSDRLDYQFDRTADQAYVLQRDGSERTGDQALAAVDVLLNRVPITSDRSIIEIKRDLFEVMDVNIEEINSYELEIAYETGQQLTIQQQLR